jgi:hypothetical protein
MTDRELLEAAAKAYWDEEEVSTRYDEDEGGLLYIHGENQDHNGRDREFVWNPLDEAFDAMRLMTALGITLKFDRESEVYAAPGDGWEYPETYAEHNGDKDAATRRAIVRAAAAMAG